MVCPDTLIVEQLRSGGLITNYYCTSQCRHCLYCSSPRWEKHYVDEATARENMEVVQQLGCHLVHIGGGEPLLNLDGLLRVLQVARSLNLKISYVETNASWYRDQEDARRCLENLLAAGLDTLLVSISPFHNEYVPFSRIKGLIRACQEVGMGVIPWVESFWGDLETLDAKRPHRLEEYQRHFGPDYLCQLSRRYWIHHGGRAAIFLGQVFGRKPAAEVVAASGGGCPELADTSHFHLDLYGRYLPGLCSGFGIETKDLGGPVDMGKYPLVALLYREGIGGFYRWAASTQGYEPRRHFFNKCDLCLDIRRYLVLEVKGSFPELHPHQFYLELQLLD